MTDWTKRARHLVVAFGIVVFGSGAIGCATPPIAYDAYGYPLDYPVLLQDRYGKCSEYRHPDCHAHHRHYFDERGDQQIYLWEHAHYRESTARASRDLRLTTSTDPSKTRNEVMEQAPHVPPGLSLITAITDRGGQIEILAEGPLDNFDSFVLEGPPRIIVDFWGVWSDVQPGRIGAETGPVAEIGVSQHIDRVRLVLHLRVGDPSYRVHPTPTGARIMLGGGGATVGGD